MKNLTLVCEAKLSIEQSAREALNPSGSIEAVVTTWGAREGADGRKFNYQPEGFSEWAKEFQSVGKPLPMFLNHNDMGMPMGEWTSFEFTDTGLTAQGRLFLNTAGGSDLYNVLKESPSLFGGVSVGAYAEEAKFVDAVGEEASADDEEAFFQITKGGLREVSVVMYPNNPKAEIKALEAFDLDGQLNPRVLEKVLREAGLTKKDAITASSIFKKVLVERDASKKSEVTPNQCDAGAVENESDKLLEALQLRELEKALSQHLTYR